MVLASRDASHFGTAEDVRSLANYIITHQFPSIATSENKYLLLLREVVKRQASLISKWQLVGFIHGVMNTDNMAISGETIDYGPCAFMDVYHPATVFSSIDIHGRYAYENQPKMAVWNLARFAETLLPFLHDNDNQALELAQEEIAKFGELYQNHWQARLGRQAKSKDENKALMESHNPAIIPRNHRVEEVLEAAEEGDLSKMHKFLLALGNPYGYTTEQEEFSKPPAPESCRYQTFCGT